MNNKKEETHQEGFQLEIRVRCRERKKGKEVGNKSQESGREALTERKGRGESEWNTQTQNFRGRGWRSKENEKHNRGASVRENETLKILIKIKLPGGSFRKSALHPKAAH